MESIIDMFVKRDYQIRQIDVITAFLYKFFNEKIYIIQFTIFEDGIT